MKSGWATPFIWDSGSAHGDRHDRPGAGRELRLDGKELWRLGGMTQATPSPVAAGGLLVRRVRLPGRGESAAVRGPARCARGDISLDAGPDEQRRSSPGFSRASPATRHRRCLSRPRVRRERQRHPAGRGRRDGQGDLQGARRWRRPHVLELAVCQRRPHLHAERGRRHVRPSRRATSTRRSRRTASAR